MGKEILLVREALAVSLVAVSLHKTTWLTIHNVKQLDVEAMLSWKGVA